MPITYTPTWADSHCSKCGREERELFGGWCIDCAGPVDYPWWCERCNDFVHADNAPGGLCGDCGAVLRRCADAPPMESEVA